MVMGTLGMWYRGNIGYVMVVDTEGTWDGNG